MKKSDQGVRSKRSLSIAVLFVFGSLLVPGGVSATNGAGGEQKGPESESRAASATQAGFSGSATAERPPGTVRFRASEWADVSSAEAASLTGRAPDPDGVIPSGARIGLGLLAAGLLALICAIAARIAAPLTAYERSAAHAGQVLAPPSHSPRTQTP